MTWCVQFGKQNESTMKTFLLFVKVLIVLCITLETDAVAVGSSCSIETTGEKGICRLFSDCPGTEEMAKSNINLPLCGFHHLTVPIVCCVNIVNQNKNAPTPNDLAIGSSGDITFPTDERLNQGLKDKLIFKGSTKSEQRCMEYTEDIAEVVHALPLLINSEPLSINVTKCESYSVALVVGGTVAYPGEFPFMAAIGFANSEDQPEWRCGGTLISDRWVLTAAHCTYSVESSPKWIRLGALDMSKDYENQRSEYLIEKVVVHPEYKYPQKYNDIALLRTNKEVEFSDVVKPACLYTKPHITQKTASATGWGQTDYAGPNSDKLLKVKLNIYDNSLCRKAYDKDIKNNNQLSKGIVDSMLCAGELRGGRDTCLGDSGGPLFVRDDGNRCRFYVVGVTSFGKLCGQENVPAIYTRVSKYVPWIESIVWR